MPAFRFSWFILLDSQRNRSHEPHHFYLYFMVSKLFLVAYIVNDLGLCTCEKRPCESGLIRVR